MIVAKGTSKGQGVVLDPKITVDDNSYAPDLFQYVLTVNGRTSSCATVTGDALDELAVSWLKYRGLIEDV